MCGGLSPGYPTLTDRQNYDRARKYLERVDPALPGVLRDRHHTDPYAPGPFHTMHRDKFLRPNFRDTRKPPPDWRNLGMRDMVRIGGELRKGNKDPLHNLRADRMKLLVPNPKPKPSPYDALPKPRLHIGPPEQRPPRPRLAMRPEDPWPAARPAPRPRPADLNVPEPEYHNEPYHPNFTVQELYKPKFEKSEAVAMSAVVTDQTVPKLTLEPVNPPAQLKVEQKGLRKVKSMPSKMSVRAACDATTSAVAHAVAGPLIKLIAFGARKESDVFYDAEEQPPRTCDTCGEEKSGSLFVQERITAACTHDAASCLACARSWLQTDLETYAWIKATCPECLEDLQHADVERLADSDTFAKYDGVLMRNLLGKDKEFRWCPNSACTSGQLHIGGEAAPRFHCIACNLEYCMVHNTIWHKGETCAEFDANSKEDVTERKARQAREEKASLALLQAVSKKCPGKGCDFSVQKSDGCDAMRCSRCQHKFCFQCLAPYTAIHAVGNSAHKVSCAHYRDPRGRLVWH
ncbi:hypothetical protein LTR85_011668 [Meristemomyces frigidus]|nr:hypothetical protein LTR85_011668 [Meristemomyces frigidus]